MEDIKLLANNEKKESPCTGCENIQSRYRDEIWHRKMCPAYNEKCETTHDQDNGTSKSGKKLERTVERGPTNTWKDWKLIAPSRWK